MTTLRATMRTSVRESGERFALDVSLEAPPGMTVLFGPSGSGKSLTLACLAGLVRVEEGRVTLGEETWEDPARRFRMPPERRRCAYVPQSLALFPHLDVLANVAFGIPSSVRGEARTARARALLERFHVGGLATRRTRTLSGGEAQRVALARAFASEPRVLLLDEPFSALDRPLRGKLIDELKTALAAAPLPTVLVTHDTDEASAFEARVVTIAAGRSSSTPSG